MEVKQGIAKYVQKETLLSRLGSGNQGKDLKPSAVTFQIGDQMIRIAIGAPVVIDDGDKIIVAGKMDKKEIFHVYAYKNLTKIVEGSADWGVRFALAAIVFLPSLLFNDLLLAFMAGSLYFLFHGFNVVDAIARVRAQIWSGPPEPLNAAPTSP
ncbi:MAG: hypothetical protein AAB300_04085 [Nitrospirota bacterium]